VVALPGEGPSLRFEILGRPAAWRDGRELDLGPGKQRAVLAVLLLTPGRPVSTASIVEAVWGAEPPDNGANVVQKYVAGLRRVLEPDRSPRAPGRLLTLTGAGYALNVPPESLDTQVFEERVKAAQAVRDAVRAEAMLREALAMWRGPALAGLNGTFFDAARDHLEEMRAGALEACADAALESGEHARLVPELLRLVAEYPLREGFRYLLMLALYRCGRQAEALAAYRDARDFFSDEFGVEPGERLRNLHVGILRSDPSLALPPEREPSTPPFAPPDPPPAPAPAPEPAPAPVIPPASVVAHSGPPHVTAFTGHHVSAAAWTVPPPAERWFPGPLRALIVALPLLTFGLATWALVAYIAARRHSRRLGLMAAGHLLLWIAFFAVAGSGDPEQATWWDGPAFLALVVTMIGGPVQLAIITAGPRPAVHLGGVPNVQLIERRVRREQARGLVLHHPSIARRLGIGRPDLPRTFDDGGLVDVNSAPEHVLASLPGLGTYHAKLIVLARTAHGPLTSVDDLTTREILPYQTLHILRDVLITVPPLTDPTPDTAPPPVEPAPGL
jgi:DNA-binding SARP family transcriptional activator